VEVVRGAEAEGLSAREGAKTRWSEQMVRYPNGATFKQIGDLKAAGLADREVFEATVYIAFRLAFSTVNDALGAQPDSLLVAETPPDVRASATCGRQPV
jgi:alkylhydroperoxidase family enzyme